MATTKYNRRAIMLAAWTMKRIYGVYRKHTANPIFPTSLTNRYLFL